MDGCLLKRNIGLTQRFFILIGINAHLAYNTIHPNTGNTQITRDYAEWLAQVVKIILRFVSISIRQGVVVFPYVKRVYALLSWLIGCDAWFLRPSVFNPS